MSITQCWVREDPINQKQCRSNQMKNNGVMVQQRILYIGHGLTNLGQGHFKNKRCTNSKVVIYHGRYKKVGTSNQSCDLVASRWRGKNEERLNYIEITKNSSNVRRHEMHRKLMLAWELRRCYVFKLISWSKSRTSTSLHTQCPLELEAMWRLHWFNFKG